MPSKNIYLSSKSIETALEEYFQYLEGFFERYREKEIDTGTALGQVTSEPVTACISSPHFNASAMDGIALDASKTFGASERNRIRLIEGRDYVEVDTGDPIPAGCNAVIMREDLIDAGEGQVDIIKGATPWQHIRVIGEDIVQGEMIIPAFHRIRPVDLGALLAGGVNSVKVIDKPRVAVIPTGTELVMPGQPLEEGNLIEYNSHIFAGLIEEWGGNPDRIPPVADDYGLILEALQKAVKEHDMVIINAGSSAGREDFTRDIIAEMGEVLTHGIAVRPGKPAVLGKIDGKPVIGIPGYPVSAFVVMENIVKPLIYKYLHRTVSMPVITEAVCSRRIVSSLKNKEFVRVKLGRVGEKLIATPLTRGAGVVMSLVRADGMLVIPQNSEGIDAGEKIGVKLLKNIEDINNTIVCTGSHDPILDLLANEIHSASPELYMASAHVGSMGGIMALQKGEAHMAGIHLLDEETGTYNASYIKRYFGEGKIALVKLVDRIQGFIVKKGNPKNVRTFADLTRQDVAFVNRQKGSGTRMLLDFNLRKSNIASRDIAGYDREEFTHMAVAAAVAFSDIDAGLGVYSAAAALDLDFIPLYREEYDLAVPVEYLEQPNIKVLLDIIRSREFRDKVNKIKGYSTDKTGQIVEV